MSKKLKRNQQITLTVKQIDEIKKNATNEAIKVSSILPIWTLRRMGWGEVRIKRFLDEYAADIDSYNRGHFTIRDVMLTLYEETGVKFE